MSEKAAFLEKARAHLEVWKADVEKLRAKAAVAAADARPKIEGEIKHLEAKIDEGKAKLAEVARTSEEAWGPLKGGMQSAWESLRAGFEEAVEKLKK